MAAARRRLPDDIVDRIAAGDPDDRDQAVRPLGDPARSAAEAHRFAGDALRRRLEVVAAGEDDVDRPDPAGSPPRFHG